MIPSTSAILFATVVLNALSGMGAPIKVTRALAEAHQPGRRSPVADDNVAKRTPTEPKVPQINRRFPRRIHYEQYIREVTEQAKREPEPEPVVAEPVVGRAPVKADAAPHRRHSRRSKNEARTPPSDKNLAKRRNSKVGGTLAKRAPLEDPNQRNRHGQAVNPVMIPKREAETKVEARAETNVEARSETKAEAPVKRTTVKVVAKKRSAKKAPSKKRSVTKGKSTVAKKRSTTKSTKNVVKRSPASSSLTKKSKRTVNAKKRSTKDKNVKRNSKNNSKRSPAAATTPNKVQLRALDVPSEHLEARHYKIIKLKSSGGGCGHKKPEPPVSPCNSCCCSCGCGQQSQGSQQPPVTPPVTPPVDTPTSGNSTTTPPIVADPGNAGTPPPYTPDSKNTPAAGTPPPAGGVTPPAGPTPPGPAAPSATVTATPAPASGKPDPKAGKVTPSPVVPSVGRRQVKVLKQRSAAKTRRRSSRNVMRR